MGIKINTSPRITSKLSSSKKSSKLPYSATTSTISTLMHLPWSQSQMESNWNPTRLRFDVYGSMILPLATLHAWSKDPAISFHERLEAYNGGSIQLNVI